MTTAALPATSPIRVLGYVRVSTGKQAESGLGEGAQITALEAEAARWNWDLQIVHEEASSASSLAKRPKLTQALADLKAHRADALAVAKLDRFSRNVHDFSGLLEQSGRQGWSLICLDLAIDTTTITGAAMAQVTVTFAEMERRKIGERTKVAMAEAKRQDPTKHMGRRSVLPVATLERIRELRSAGLSMADTVEALTAEGVATATGKSWHRSTIRQIESSSAYAALSVSTDTVSE